MSIIKRNNYAQQKAKAEIDHDDVLLVELIENATTGYRWQLRQHKGFELTERYEQHSNAPGGGGAVIFTLTPNSHFESCVLKFEYRRPWEQDAKPEAIYTLQVKAQKKGD